MKGKPGEWYQDEYVGGYFNKTGDFVVCEEYNLTDADIDKYAVEVQNGEGYYNDSGKYRSYGKDDMER